MTSPIYQGRGSGVQFGYVAEAGATPGTTPTATFQQVAIINESLEYSRDNIVDNSIRGDRMQYYDRLGNLNAGGKISVPYAPATTDDFIAAAFGSVWASNAVIIGNTLTTFSVEVAHTDFATPIYRGFKGMAVSSMELDISQGNKESTVDYTFVGMNSIYGTASLSAATPYTATLSDPPFTHLDVGSTFTIGGTISSGAVTGGVAAGYITGVKLKLDNKIAANHTLGSATARGLSLLQSDLTFTLTGWFEDLSQFTNFSTEQIVPITFTLTNNSHTHTWLIPATKILSWSAPTNGDGPIPVSMSCVALKEATTGTTVKLTRT
jgi:hypothetical protein